MNLRQTARCGWAGLAGAIMAGGLLLAEPRMPTEDSLQNYKSEELIRILALPVEQMPPSVATLDDPYGEICAVLLRQKEVPTLLNAFERATEATVRTYLVKYVLGEIDDPRVVESFRRQLGEGEDEGDYYVANYLAQRGDRPALEVLNRHYFQYPVSSLQWADTAGLFGKFKYRPAIPNLIDSLHAASLNLVGAAIESLREFYPDAPVKFGGLDEMQVYFKKRFEQETKAATQQGQARQAGLPGRTTK